MMRGLKSIRSDCHPRDMACLPAAGHCVAIPMSAVMQDETAPRVREPGEDDDMPF
jgi:hypothetical protein